MRKKFKNLFFGILFLIFFALFIKFLQENLENFLFAQISKPIEEISFANFKAKPKKPPLNLNVKSALAVKIDPRKRVKILYKKNENSPLPIASLTKLMSALLVFENYNLKEKIKISKKACQKELVPNYGNLKEGQVFSVKKLLWLSLVYSSNHATFALAEKMGIENFVNLMNEKAKEIGMEKTKFYNPTGLENKGLNVASAKDLFYLTKYILEKKPQIFEISRNLGPYLPENSIFDIDLKGKKLIGGKTGYLPEAGGCMILVFERGPGTKIICIILGAKNQRERVIQMQKLVDWVNG